MKVPAATLTALLLVTICSPAEAHRDDSNIGAPTQKKATAPTFCCFSYMVRMIPRRSIASAYMTSNICPQPAVILVTRKGREVCADPQMPWVQAYLKHIPIMEHQHFPADTPLQQARSPAPDTQQSA
ncbi:C-C motif chemokine 4-like [Egretta garzetta]|uniref:C-C motif chemokine 4-like n=1 Tax=Egretta garzetta TaxID=188379 RepID=UPI00051F02CA|nr:C-C motif chemokine 4-like [Egretta garzetta]